MENSVLAELEGVKSELLVVGEQITDLLERQEVLLEKKQMLQAQLDSLDQKHSAHLQTIDWENGHFEWSDRVSSLLKSRFKLDSFRSLQSSTINATISKEDVILIMPTGGGKSLCYQLPALLEPGVSLVISPLVSLMEDQLLAVKSLGIESAMLNASCGREEVNRVHSSMTDGKSGLKLLYVTPEKLAKSKRFMSKLEKMYEVGRLSRIVIDEVHCASQWGHDFRPDYKILGILKRQFPDAPILGLTATATAKVLADCQKILSLKSCLTFKSSYNRPNLFYEVRPKPSSQKGQVEEISKLIKTRFPKQSGIVYCLSRSNVEEVCKELCLAGIPAGCYHTDRLPGERTRVHTQWLNNTLQVIVATIAFGMGIDKPDVRFVIHHSLSKSMENYYQESGRAGRDGNTAHCILFYRSADAFRQSAMVFTEHTGLSNLFFMMRYCINEVECRRALIAMSFGEKWSPNDCPSACDVCVKLCGSSACGSTSSGSKKASYQVTKIDVSQHAKSLVLIVKHNQAKQQRVTAAKLVDIWRGHDSSSRPSHIPSANIPTEQCERVVVTALLEGALKEEFHYTAYTTICYIGLGRKAELAKKGLFKIELPSLIVCKDAKTSLSKEVRNTTGSSQLVKRTNPVAETHVDRTKRLPNMLPSEQLQTSDMLLLPSGSDMKYQCTLSQQEGTTPGTSLKSTTCRGRGKGKKRGCSDAESSTSPSKRPRTVSTPASARDVIEIDDSD